MTGVFAWRNSLLFIEASLTSLIKLWSKTSCLVTFLILRLTLPLHLKSHFYIDPLLSEQEKRPVLNFIGAKALLNLTISAIDILLDSSYLWLRNFPCLWKSANFVTVLKPKNLHKYPETITPYLSCQESRRCWPGETCAEKISPEMDALIHSEQFGYHSEHQLSSS